MNTKFWKNFVTKYFEKKSTKFKKENSPFEIFNQKEIFEMVCQCVDTSQKAHPYVRFYIEGESKEIQGATLQLLPKISDHNFEGYHRRIKKVLTGKGYYLVIGDFHARNFTMYSRLIRLAQGMAQITGRTKRRIDAQIFIGDHDKTPFGVHIDETSVFHIPVVGQKRMRFWEPGELQKHPELDGATTYNTKKSKSSLIEAKVGEVIYWPSKLWHVAESKGKFSVTWGLGWWVGENSPLILKDKLQSLAVDVLEEKLPKELFFKKQIIQKNWFKEQFFDKAISTYTSDVSETLLISYLKTKSTFGFWLQAKPEKTAALHVQQFTKSKILPTLAYFSKANHKLYVVCNGSVLTIPLTRKIPALVKKIVSHGPVQIAKSEIKSKGDKKIIDFLVENGGLDLVS